MLDRTNLTPLHTATNNDNAPVVSALVEAGANPNLHGIGGATPLHIGVSLFENNDILSPTPYCDRFTENNDILSPTSYLLFIYGIFYILFHDISTVIFTRDLFSFHFILFKHFLGNELEFVS